MTVEVVNKHLTCDESNHATRLREYHLHFPLSTGPSSNARRDPCGAATGRPHAATFQFRLAGPVVGGTRDASFDILTCAQGAGSPSL